MIVTDIEGTTSDIAFVKDTLFPYAAAALPDFVRQQAKDESVQPLIAEAAALAGLEAKDLEAVIAQFLAWIETDQKITPLKTLQGLVWETGYRSGVLQAHVYPDAFEALKAWHTAGIPLYVYSSGSIKAQQLFFEHSVFGDLRYLFADYFDTTTGPKMEASAYEKIASEIGHAPDTILFLSDQLSELDAARTAGLETCWVQRNKTVKGSEKDKPSPNYPCVRSFSEIAFST